MVFILHFCRKQPVFFLLPQAEPTSTFLDFHFLSKFCPFYLIASFFWSFFLSIKLGFPVKKYRGRSSGKEAREKFLATFDSDTGQPTLRAAQSSDSGLAPSKFIYFRLQIDHTQILKVFRIRKKNCTCLLNDDSRNSSSDLNCTFDFSSFSFHSASIFWTSWT